VRILITGATGFVGNILTRHLLDTAPDSELHGTAYGGQSGAPGITYHEINLVDPNATHALIARVQPDQIYHLAGQAFVPRSFEDPWETLEINIRAQLNIIRSCLTLGLRPRLLITSSAEVYGDVQQVPINEDAPLRPSSPYSVSKAAQDLLGLQYFLSHQMPVLRARAFNHIGPGQSDRFVAPAFAIQIARIEAGQQEPTLYVGDLSDRRDFTDVRDIVRAYALIMERGIAGDVYNVASGEARSIQSLLDTLLKHTTARISVQVDPERLRPSRIPILQGDCTRLKHATGWQPAIPFEQTLRDVLEDCRQRVAHS
jgi:GDP-4-dehydro-6-deoxy-D-mannose reductase